MTKCLDCGCEDIFFTRCIPCFSKELKKLKVVGFLDRRSADGAPREISIQRGDKVLTYLLFDEEELDNE